MNSRIQRIVLTPLKSHYDKIIVFLALGVFIATTSMLFVESGKRGQEVFKLQKMLDGLTPVYPNVTPLTKDPFASGRVGLTNAFQLALSVSKTTLIVPEERVSCVYALCRKPIPFTAEVCPFCFRKQGIENKPKDSDSDFMPDFYESKYGLNPFDNADADIDSDGDGFTNLQEYKAGIDLGREFNPKSDKSVPPAWWAGSLEVKSTRALKFDLMYMSSMLAGSNLLFVINDVGASRTTYSKRLGEKVNGFTLLKHEEKFMWTNSVGVGTMKEKVDVSELTLLSPSKTLVVLVKGQTKFQWERSAELFCRSIRKSLTVKEGESVQIGGYKYQVKDIDVGSKKVLISDPVFGIEVWIAQESSGVAEPGVLTPVKSKLEVPAPVESGTGPVPKEKESVVDPFETK